MQNEQLSFNTGPSEEDNSRQSGGDLGVGRPDRITPYDPNDIGQSDAQDDLGGGIASARHGTLPTSPDQRVSASVPPRIGSFDKINGNPITNDRELRRAFQSLQKAEDQQTRRDIPR